MYAALSEVISASGYNFMFSQKMSAINIR